MESRTTFATTKVKPGPQGNAALALDGKKCGLIYDLSGGDTFAEVVQEHMGLAYVPKKHLGGIKYEDFSLQIGFAMDTAVFDWIAAAWNLDHPRKNGSIIACDSNMEAKSERQFTNALITETTIPTLDGNSKDPAWLNLKFAPEILKTVKASGKVSAADPKNPEKLLLPSNFKLEIDGLECSKVARIEAFTVKQAVHHDHIGHSHHAQVEPGKLEFPNLKVTLGDVADQSWLDYFDDFVVKGNSGEGKEKSGSLKLLSPNQQPLATIKFFHLGICRIGHASSSVAGDKVKLATAELYCERMEFHFGK
jgi:hypothetical protein